MPYKNGKYALTVRILRVTKQESTFSFCLAKFEHHKFLSNEIIVAVGNNDPNISFTKQDERLYHYLAGAPGLGLFAPYFERPLLLALTPEASNVPLII